MDFCCVGSMRPRGESATSANRGSRDNQQTDRSRCNQFSGPSFGRRARPHTRTAAAARLSDFGIVEQSRSGRATVFCETGESKAASIDAGICLLESHPFALGNSGTKRAFMQIDCRACSGRLPQRRASRARALEAHGTRGRERPAPRWPALLLKDSPNRMAAVSCYWDP
jgi:hypothetical protein